MTEVMFEIFMLGTHIAGKGLKDLEKCQMVLFYHATTACWRQTWCKKGAVLMLYNGQKMGWWNDWGFMTQKQLKVWACCDEVAQEYVKWCSQNVVFVQNY